METSAGKLHWGVKHALFVIVLLLSITSKSNSTTSVSTAMTNATASTSSTSQVATSAAASTSITPSTAQATTGTTSNTTVALSKGACDGVPSRSLYLLSASFAFVTVMLF